MLEDHCSPWSALRAGHTLDELKEKLGINHNRHKRYPNLVALKYGQIDSPMGNPLVQKCRGVVLDEASQWRVVARPFDKFFNAHEGHAAEIDWSTARVQEKVDGSLIFVYDYAGKWHAATSGTPDASGQVNGYPFTFAELFWKTWREAGYEEPQHCLLDGLTYIFELTSPYNRVVVRQSEPRITALGIRHSDEAGHEHSLIDGAAVLLGMPPSVRSFPLKSLEDVVASFEAIDPTSQEGYVVVDAGFNRIKVKHPGYVALHHMKGGLTPKGLLEVVRTGETSELVANFPEWKGALEKVSAGYEKLITDLDSAWAEHGATTDRKQFALAVKGLKACDALFLKHSGKITDFRSHLRGIHIERLAERVDLSGVVLDGSGLPHEGKGAE